MAKIICWLLFVLSVALPFEQIYADGEIARILQSWNEHYGALAESDQYHYRCVVKRTCKKPGLSLNQVRLEAVRELGLEIFRLGQASRMDAILGRNFSTIDQLRDTHIFDGRAGFHCLLDRDGSRYCQIYPASRDFEEFRRQVQPDVDPLADVLGLSVPADSASWALGIPPDAERFDLATALAQGQFRVASQNAELIELCNANGDQLALSVARGYALARRTWTWTLDTTLNCSLENREWKQFSDGTWYPEISQIVCWGRSGTDVGEELLSVDYRFSTRPASKRSDFEVTAAHPGTDLEYHGPDNDYRLRTLKAGETIDLTRLAHDQLSIRWDDRQSPYSVLEKWSIIPLTMIAAFLAIRLAANGQARSGPLPPRRAIWLALLLGATFLFLIHLAMWLYQGGAKSDKALTSYSWTLNYLSDLGREYRYDDGDNHPVGVVFMLALCVAGAATVLYAWPLPELFRRPLARRLATLAAVCGLIAGWSYIRIGWAPVDSYRDEHYFYETVGFLSFGIMALLYAAALLLESGYPRRYGWSLLAFCVLLAAFVLLRQIDGPHWRSASSLSWRATAQKIVVFSQVLCLTVQATGGLQWLKRQQTEDSSSRIL
jgi:hypothetical membrane protein